MVLGNAGFVMMIATFANSLRPQDTRQNLHESLAVSEGKVVSQENGKRLTARSEFTVGVAFWLGACTGIY